MADSTSTLSDSARSTSTLENRVPLALLFLRLSIFLVLFMWVLDKFIKPDHAAQVFQFFYGVGGLGAVPVYLFGLVQLLIILAFVVGFQKKFTYAVVFAMHAASTLVSYKHYLDPFTSPNLLFFAAFPMLAGCFALYHLRDLDTRWTIK